MTRSLILLYGVAAYFAGVAGLACIIAALAGFIPYGFWKDGTASIVDPILWNFLLVITWGGIHTIMARPRFKAVLTLVIQEPAERATYILVAGITSVALIGFWQPISGQVWHIESGGLAYGIWAIFIFGWAFLLAATFAIDHFDLFGLRQVFLNFKRQPRPPLHFVKRAMYKYVRHPIQTGVLIGIWATPSMSMTQIVLSLGFTAYIYVGLWFEERDLIREHGDAYLKYRQEAGHVFPKIRQSAGRTDERVSQ